MQIVSFEFFFLRAELHLVHLILYGTHMSTSSSRSLSVFCKMAKLLDLSVLLAASSNVNEL